MNFNLLKPVWPFVFILGCVSLSWILFFSNTNQSQVYENEELREREVVEIPSSVYSNPQKALLYKCNSDGPRPLLVSLHSWGGAYDQADTLFEIARSMNWNYIHPDFGGPLWNPNSCCFPASIEAIDEAIAFALKETGADTSKIVVIGKSGGGSGVLGAYLKSSYGNAYFMSWSPITDFISWHDEVLKDSVLSKKYLAKINLGTGSESYFETTKAKEKSPLYIALPELKIIQGRRLLLYVGIYDGTAGWSTGIQQQIGFYNKLRNHFQMKDSVSEVLPEELRFWVEHRAAYTGNQSRAVGDRKGIASKGFHQVSLFLFEGGHEIRYQEVINQLITIESL